MRRDTISLRSLILVVALLATAFGLVAVMVVARARPGARAETAAAAPELARGDALREISARLASIEREAARRERAAVDPGALREIVGQAVAEQLRAAAGTGAPGAAAAPPPSAEDERRQIAAFDAGRALVDARLDARSWRASDAQALRHLLIAMAPEQRELTMTRITMAINRQDLRDEVDGPSY
jgi:hypothetical protein